jgi:ATP-dependent HslUV protease ATP-binding subunit HslU
MEHVLEDISFTAPEQGEQTVVIDEQYVRERLKGILENRDLSRYIL